MTKILLTKTLKGDLKPADEPAREYITELRHGQDVWLEVRRARNPRRHRLFWGLVQIIRDNTDLQQSPEAIADYLKLRGGHVEVFKRPGGEVVQVPKSISFSKCSEDEFKGFIDRLLDIVRTEIIPGLPEDDLRRELEDIAGLTQPQERK